MTEKKPKYTHKSKGWSGEYVLKDGEPIATTVWGCDCCKPTVTPEHEATAADIAHKLSTYDDLVTIAQKVVLLGPGKCSLGKKLIENAKAALGIKSACR